MGNVSIADTEVVETDIPDDDMNMPPGDMALDECIASVFERTSEKL